MVCQTLMSVIGEGGDRGPEPWQLPVAMPLAIEYASLTWPLTVAMSAFAAETAWLIADCAEETSGQHRASRC